MGSELGGGWRLLLLLRRSSSLLLLLLALLLLLLLLLALLLLLKQGLPLGGCDEPGHMLTLDPVKRMNLNHHNVTLLVRSSLDPFNIGLPVKLRDPAPCMLQPVPGHLQHLNIVGQK